MNPPIYPILLTNYPLPYSSFSPFLYTDPASQPYAPDHQAYSLDHQIYSPGLQAYEQQVYSSSFLNALPSIVLNYPLVQNCTEASELQSQTRGWCNSQEGVAGSNWFLCSPKSLPAEPESKVELASSSGSAKKDWDNSMSEITGREECSGKKEGRAKEDTEYVPHRSEKRVVRKRVNSNENRNVIPNEINQILSFLHKRSKSQALLRRVWAKYPPPAQHYSVTRFYLLQKHLKEKVGHYCNQASLNLLSTLVEPECKIWSSNQQRHYIMLSRVLIGHFLREDSIFAILTSKRMKREKKLEHLRTRRLVGCLVKQALRHD